MTKPRTDQLRFRSSANGEIILDAYLEAAEKGGRALGDLLSDIFDPDTGTFRSEIFDFREDPLNPGVLQFRVGDYADPDAGWVDMSSSLVDLVEQAEAARDTAVTAAGTATTQAGIATTQAGNAATQVGLAAAQVTLATTQANNAATQAGTATTQAGIATTQAGIATTKAAEAAASASAAALSEINAGAAEDNAAQSVIDCQALVDSISGGPVTSVAGETGIVTVAELVAAGLASAASVSAKQDASTILDNIAALTMSANQSFYFTSSTAVTAYTVTSQARQLLDDTSFAAMLATLGAQASSTLLTAIASVTAAADRVPYFTSSSAASVMTVTSAARSLLDDTTTGAMLTTLGAAAASHTHTTSQVTGLDTALAAKASLTGAETLTAKTMQDMVVTNGYIEETYAFNSGTVSTIALTNGSSQLMTLTGNCTLTFPTAAAGRGFTLMAVQDATGGRTITWPATVKWAGGTAPTLTATAAKADRFSFKCFDGTNWHAVVNGQNY